MMTEVNSNKGKPILIVEDEADIRDLISLHVKRAGFACHDVDDAEEALLRLQSNEYRLIILDWMLPGKSGFEMIKVLRENDRYGTLPILMVTAKGEDRDIIMGLEAGADDYVTKPFEPTVLMARVNALVRRSGLSRPASTPLSPEIDLGDLKIRPQNHEVSVHGKPIDLTPSEFKLLLALVTYQGRVLTRSRLLELVQGDGVYVIERAIDTHIFGLRKKLGSCADLVETVRGVGYRVRELGVSA